VPRIRWGKRGYERRTDKEKTQKTQEKTANEPRGAEKEGTPKEIIIPIRQTTMKKK